MAAVGLLTLELHLAEALSLKDKRQVVRSLKERLRRHFNVSVAEVDHQSSLRLATVAVAAAAPTGAAVERLLARVEREAAELLGRELADSSIELL